MDPVFLFVFFGFTKVALIVGMGWIVVSGLKRWEELEADKRAAAERAALAEAPANAPAEAPEEIPEPVRRAA